MKVYIAGPMKGKPEFNFPLFNAVAYEFRSQGHEVFNPAENDKCSQGMEPDKLVPSGCVKELEAKHGFSRRRALGEDLHWIALNADAIVMLPDWEHSTGAYAEWALAKALGLKFYYWDTGLNDFSDT